MCKSFNHIKTAQFNDLKNQLATNATQQSDYIKTLTQSNNVINTGLQNKIESLARDNATNITNFNTTEKANAQTISNLTSSLANTNNTITQHHNNKIASLRSNLIFRHLICWHRKEILNYCELIM